MRILGGTFLVFAAIRIAADIFSSFHTQHQAARTGFIIDHSFAIDHVAIIAAISGALLFLVSFVMTAKRT